ncbi:glycosyltransferase family 2 protein [Halomonas cerina]|uniref:Glycosyltransferase involved in cell wall biosynthesis n=1 Tax=Halomonas cerina TaxID=447424 RepID=A0A839VII6_9GAMM|nr:glycosyltransferase family 2 protein [Halomonas cerina]MBB3192196.1 glycosyltransferase involved in cell wall biosynthesis [Halomonas cerina]
MNDTKPSVAIIIPCFNRWPHVQEAIDSVLAQTWPNTRCIVVDDASTDDSLVMLRQHYQEEPRVIIEALSKNQGQSAARNHGVSIADADYIGFLDSDDLLVTTAVESRMRLAIEHPDFEGILFGEKIDEKSRESLLPGIKEEGDSLFLSEYIKRMDWLHTNSFLMKRDSFLYLNGFDETLRKKEDVEFFIRALYYQPALYAPGPSCIVRSVSPHRARHDHHRIIEQGERFVEAIQANTKLLASLTSIEKEKLVEADIRSALQSLYRTKQGKKFRNTLRTGIKHGKLRLDARLAKRYLLSFFQK